MKKFLSSFERMVLLAVYGGATEAVDIREKLSSVGHRSTIGALYTTLMRLKMRGYLSSNILPKRDMAGGRRRMSYTVTPAGRKHLEEYIKAAENLLGDIKNTKEYRLLQGNFKNEKNEDENGNTPAPRPTAG